MEKQIFLDRVGNALLERGIGRPIVERQLEKLSRYIDSEWGENAAAMLEEENPEMLAEEIYSIVRKNAVRRAAAEAATAEIEIPTAVPAETVVPSAGFDADEPYGNAQRADRPAEDYIKPDLTAFNASTPPRMEAPLEHTFVPAREGRRGQTLEVDPFDSRAAEYEDEKAGPLFWVIFILALPFLLALGLLVISVFMTLFVALITLMIASILVLAVVAAAGTAFSIAALVYGIVQALSTLPIGLYEIGIGVIAGAVVLFCSILLYNFAIRLLPFLMRMLGRLFGWSIRRLKALFIYVKGECAKL
ncbi:MAG: phage holin family protein [Clostridia bacterium]|nr:phage holin family protein [Clostridia bacterium]